MKMSKTQHLAKSQNVSVETKWKQTSTVCVKLCVFLCTSSALAFFTLNLSH